METKKKKCISCNTLDYIKGYKLCNKCYSIKLFEFQKAKTNNKTKARNLKEYITGSSTYIQKETKQSQKIVIDALHIKLRKLTHDYVKDLFDINGHIICYTCDNKYERKEIDAGHFQHGHAHAATMYEYKFIKPQCIECNRYNSGMGNVFETKLRLEYGDAVIDDFILRSHAEASWTTDKLNSLINNIKSLSKQLTDDNKI